MNYYNGYKKSFSERVIEFFIPGFIILVFVGIVVSFVFRACGSYSNDTANLAERYLDRMGVKHGPVDCMSRDTDGDGYISCSYSSEGNIHALECGYLWNEGCRLPKNFGQAIQNQ